jgi:hypothetical protein
LSYHTKSPTFTDNLCPCRVTKAGESFTWNTYTVCRITAAFWLYNVYDSNLISPPIGVTARHLY